MILNSAVDLGRNLAIAWYRASLVPRCCHTQRPKLATMELQLLCVRNGNFRLTLSRQSLTCTGYVRPSLRGQKKLLDEHRRLHPAALQHTSQDASKKGGVAISSPQKSDKSNLVTAEDTTDSPLHKSSPSSQDGALREGTLEDDAGQHGQEDSVEGCHSKFRAFKQVGSTTSCKLSTV